MSQQFELLTLTLTDGSTQQVYRASAGAEPFSGNWEISWECVACGIDFPASKIRWFEGGAYGIPCGCAKDIPRLREAASGHLDEAIDYSGVVRGSPY